jgi:hypothetical protein
MTAHAGAVAGAGRSGPRPTYGPSVDSYPFG